MSDMTRILRNYSNGVATLEDTNKALDEIGAGFHLDPDRNKLTEEEMLHGTAGLLDTGTGTLDKVKIINGELEHEVGFGLCIVSGKTYIVRGKKLFES